MILWRQLSKTKPKSNKKVLFRNRKKRTARTAVSLSLLSAEAFSHLSCLGGGNLLSYDLTGVPPPPRERTWAQRPRGTLPGKGPGTRDQ